MILGAFTPEVSNNSYNVFATDLVQGNTIILEYFEPESSDDGVIHISEVIHGYVNIKNRGVGDSASCNVDVMCRPFGTNWEKEEKAVCLIIMGEYAGSGSLINNTRQDFTPYILTARHNYFDTSGNTPNRNPATSIFRFHYWRPNCGSGTPNSSKSISGATLRAQWTNTDFALLELNTRPPVDWILYYAGWDRTTISAQPVTAIHHLSADAMKISRDDHTVISSGNFWSVPHFEQGTIQP